MHIKTAKLKNQQHEVDRQRSHTAMSGQFNARICYAITETTETSCWLLHLHNHYEVCYNHYEVCHKLHNHYKNSYVSQ